MSIRGSWFISLALAAAYLVSASELRAHEWVPAPPAPLPNGFFISNPAGASTTFSEEGFVNRADDFHTPQGSNGRTCASCHAAEAGWSLTPEFVKRRFLATDGLDPLFNPMDANAPNLDLTTVAKRKQGYSMLLEGLFRRGGVVRPEWEFEIVAVDDPFGVGSTSAFSFYRRPLAISNLKLMSGVHWDGRFTVPGEGAPPRAGLLAQANANIRNGQQRDAASPPPSELLNAIADDELQLWHAQIAVLGIGRLDSCGARGGPEWLSVECRRQGRFDLFDAWIDFVPGKCDPRPEAAALRAQIARGQEIFNARTNANGRTCQGCDNVANNGSHMTQDETGREIDRYFDIAVSGIERRLPTMPLYEVRQRCAQAPCPTRFTTDPGRAIQTGVWNDLNAFKVPTLRGAVARAPYFRNGSAKTLRDVVRHYRELRGFDFSQQEEDDLVPFLSAL